MKLDPHWIEDGEVNDWVMPRAAWWKRLPVIRRFRAAWHGLRVAVHQDAWTRATGALHSGYDNWVLYGIAKGQERPL